MKRAADPIDDSVEQAACDWFACQRSGAMTPAEARDLEAWLAADPAHRDAFEALRRSWASLEAFRSAPEMLARRAQARGRYAGFPRKVIMRAAAVAAVAVVAGGAVAWSLGGAALFDFRRFSSQEYRTAVGEKTSVTLPDGSVVTLNTDTVLRTRADEGERLVYLDRGQAFFRVAKDAEHPFIVHAAGRTVTAVGTAFDVRVDAHRFEVTLVEGRVRVAAPAPTIQTTELVAGNQFVAPDPRHWAVSAADTARETSWLTGRLKFENQPLEEVAAEFGRYSDRKIVIDDPALAREAISGAFEADDIDNFLRTLNMAKIARVEAVNGSTIKLAAY